jgi:hypothetical protein
MADYLLFSEIYGAVERGIKHYDSSMTAMVKEMVNMTYFEIMGVDELYPFYWMVDLDDTLASVAPADVSGVTKANPGVITTSAAHGLSVNDLVTMHNLGGMTELNDRIYTVASVPLSTTFTTSVDTSGYTTYTSGGTVHHRGKTLATSGKDVQRLLWVSWHDEDIMTPITPEEIEKEASRYHWTSVTQRPERYRHVKSFAAAGTETNQIIWYPGADAAYDLRYWLEKRPAKLAADANVPLLPPQFHYGIVAGTIMRLAEAEVQVENQIIWPGIYKQTIESLKEFNRKYWKQQENMDAKPPYLL